MVTIAALWFPILLSAVVVFMVSAAVWMVMPHHKFWFGLPASVAFKHSLDGLAYALLTAGIFGWLWPAS